MVVLGLLDVSSERHDMFQNRGNLIIFYPPLPSGGARAVHAFRANKQCWYLRPGEIGGFQQRWRLDTLQL